MSKILARMIPKEQTAMFEAMSPDLANRTAKEIRINFWAPTMNHMRRLNLSDNKLEVTRDLEQRRLHVDISNEEIQRRQKQRQGELEMARQNGGAEGQKKPLWTAKKIEIG